MHHTGKKESEKEILEVSENLLQGYSNPDTQNQLVLKASPSIYWTPSVNPCDFEFKRGIYSFPKGIDSFQG